MDWKKLALCMALAGGTVACGGGEGTEDPVTRRYVLSAVQIPAATGTTAAGFNLDDEISTGDDDSSCVGLTPDFDSANDPGEQGIDNQLGTLVPMIGTLLMDSCPEGTPAADCVSALLAEQVREGSLLLVMEVRDINSFANDDDIEMQLYLGTVPGCDDTMPETCAPELTGETIAPGQDFEVMAVGSPVSGSITAGRMTAVTDRLDIAIDTGDAELTLVLRNAEVRANITETSLSNGAIGGSINIEELATAAETFMAGAGALIRSVVGAVADLDPDPAMPLDCRAISAGIAFTAVDAAEPE